MRGHRSNVSHCDALVSRRVVCALAKGSHLLTRHLVGSFALPSQWLKLNRIARLTGASPDIGGLYCRSPKE